jgi:hypothetical protein
MPPGGNAQPDPRTRGRWRWVRRAIVCLFIGAAVNVLVAWGCALWAKPTGPIAVREQMPTEPRGSPDPTPELAMFILRSVDTRSGLGITRTQHWGSYSGEPGYGWVLVRAVGLPMRSMMIRWPSVTSNLGLTSQPADGTLNGGVSIEGNSRVIVIGSHGDDALDQFVGRRLPLAVLPLGCAVNSLIFAMCILGVMVGRDTWRAWRRSRAGCCVYCGYDLATLPITIECCPECGEPRSKRSD